jgi:hypothetical protein
MRRAALRFLGWCPGVEAAARFIPENRMPDRAVHISIAGGFLLLLLYLSLVTAVPRSYAWDLGFEEADLDEALNMYVREEAREFRGTYSVRIWVEAPENTTVQVHLLEEFYRPWRSGGYRTREVEEQFGIQETGTFRNGLVYWYGGGPPQGDRVIMETDLYNPYRWRACSESTEATVHMRIEFLSSGDRSPGRPPL